ncbi:MAG: bifunctional phosphoserine phosphatase/homoserine phosphotransferase ThrH [Gammaproteobacteria bacterium]|nr:bifunctional phosphoserine phosphatase/homoserine phosphotransferase ThrH [Gammaproteobacteria bacterium]
MNIACLDFEGVLVPEIWVGLAARTGIEELRATTREIPDYDQLMAQRLNLMAKHKLGLRDIQVAADELEPLPGALAFLTWLRTEYQVAIVSDTFYELAAPLVRKLNFPLLLCHRLQVVASGRITGYVLRQPDPKRQAVRGFKAMNFKVVATGDSYNDVPMLEEADRSWFFGPPDNVCRDHPAIPAVHGYAELRAALVTAKADFS